MLLQENLYSTEDVRKKKKVGSTMGGGFRITSDPCEKSKILGVP